MTTDVAMRPPSWSCLGYQECASFLGVGPGSLSQTGRYETLGAWSVVWKLRELHEDVEKPFYIKTDVRIVWNKMLNLYEY